jgi:hypothetical protein
MVASPHTGNQSFVDLFDQTIADYRLFNYILDIVPRVPLGSRYTSDRDLADDRRGDYPSQCTWRCRVIDNRRWFNACNR